MFLVRLSLTALIVLLLFPLRGDAQEGPPAGSTVVYLRSAEIVQRAPGSADAQRTFERELTEMRAELQQQGQVVDSLLQDYQRQEVLLSPQAKEEKQQHIRGRQQELVGRQRELESRAQQRQQELLAPILQQVSEVIEQIRRERGYSLVLDASTEGVVAADTTLDMTALVLSRLGAAAAPDTTSSQ